MEEIIQHGKTGLLVPPEDVNALAAAFVQLLNGQELRCQMGLAGRKRVADGFTWDHVVDRLAPIIHDALEQNPKIKPSP